MTNMNVLLDGMNFIAVIDGIEVTATAQNLDELGFTAAQVKKARAAVITVETAEVRWKAGTPTAALGHLIPIKTTVTVMGKKTLALIKFIEVSGTPVITISLFQ